MSITRLLYFSENQIDPAQGSMLSQLRKILSVSNRNNELQGLTGSLVFDGLWFLQVLEGERETVWRAFQKISLDERHTDVQMVEMTTVRSRVFGNWWMGFGGKNDANAATFSSYFRHGKLQPRLMSAEEIMSLMISLAELGSHRSVNSSAAA